MTKSAPGAKRNEEKDELINELACALDGLMDVEGSEPPQSDDEETQRYFDEAWQDAADVLRKAAEHLNYRLTAYRHAGYKYREPTVEEKLDVHEEGP